MKEGNGSYFDKQIISMLKFYLPDIIKSTIFLGFNYFEWIVQLLTILLLHIVEEKNLRKHFALVCIKEFLEIGVISDNFYTYVQKEDQG